MLRVRKVGRAHVQSVKMSATGGSSLAQRLELESPLRDERPDLMQIADPDVRRLIQQRCARNDLVPVFTTNVARETWLLQVGRSRIECAIDRGAIEADGKKAPICEVELELKSGQAARLFQLAHRLNAVVPLRIEPASKPARGYDLVRNVGLAAPRAAAIHIDPAKSVRDAFAAITQPCVAHIVAAANFAGKSDDPEGIHELRVAIRRMRAAFSIFRNAVPENDRFRIGDELRTLQRKLGAAREWDVLVEETIAGMPGRLRRQRATEDLVRLAQARRAEAYKTAHAALRNPRSTDLVLRLASWADSQFGSDAPPAGRPKWKPDVLGGPVAGFASGVKRAYHDKARKLGRKIHKLDAAGLHQLRIRIKKLRYAMEFFASIWPGRQTKRYLSALKSLQQVIGAWHDETVAEGLVTRLRTAAAHDAALSSAPIDRWIVKRQRRTRKEVVALWDKFEKTS